MHCLILLVALSTVVPPQQQAVTVLGPPDLIVTKKGWSKFYLPVGGDRDPFAPNDLVREQARAAREAQAVNRDRGRTGEPLVRPPAMQIHTSSLSDLRPGMAAYSYTIKVRNAGAKTIRGFEWAYVFIDPKTDQEVGRIISRHNAKVSPGKNNELVGYSNTPPTRIIDAKRTASHTSLKERIEIYLIRYEDGSVWQRPPVEGLK